eukprot:SAG31_NODE_8679_length_1407_cov_1.637615_2_plen_94_part_00
MLFNVLDAFLRPRMVQARVEIDTTYFLDAVADNTLLQCASENPVDVNDVTICARRANITSAYVCASNLICELSLWFHGVGPALMNKNEVAQEQ